MPQFLNCCRLCGATSYRRVIGRDGEGAMRATGLFSCSGCSIVFSDPRAWRSADPDDIGSEPPIRPITPADQYVPPSPPHRPTGPGPSAHPPAPICAKDPTADA